MKDPSLRTQTLQHPFQKSSIKRSGFFFTKMSAEYEFEQVVLSTGFVNQKITSYGVDTQLTLFGTISSDLINDTYFKTKLPDVVRKYFYLSLVSNSLSTVQHLSTLVASNMRDSDWTYIPCIALQENKNADVRFKIKFHEDVLVQDTVCNNHTALGQPKGCKARIVCEPNVYFNCDDKKYGLYFTVKQIIF